MSAMYKEEVCYAFSGPALREAREEAGYSSATLSTMVGVTRAEIWRWENGVRHPRESMVNLLAEAFGMSRAHLINDEAE